jgi:hypothetical protein
MEYAMKNALNGATYAEEAQLDPCWNLNTAHAFCPEDRDK